MRELLRHLRPGSVILDLRDSSKEIDLRGLPLTQTRLPHEARDRSIDLVLLDTFPCSKTIEELRRVLNDNATIYAVVADPGTLTAIVFRWLSSSKATHGRQHTPRQFADRLSQGAGKPLQMTRTLYSSFSFLNRRNQIGRPQKKLLLFAGGSERLLVFMTWVLRRLDLAFGSRMSVYGSEMFFGNLPPGLDREEMKNVCVRCGSGHSRQMLWSRGVVGRKWGFPVFRCPNCQRANLLIQD